MNLPAAPFRVQSLICSKPTANAAPEPQLTQCRWATTSLASAHVKMNDDGRVCGLNRQLTTTVLALAAEAFRVVSAVSVARVGADAQAVAATESTMAMSTATRFMVSSLA